MNNLYNAKKTQKRLSTTELNENKLIELKKEKINHLKRKRTENHYTM